MVRVVLGTPMLFLSTGVILRLEITRVKYKTRSPAWL